MSGAEVILGVISGCAGIASLSIQLQESVKKLRRFYKSIKHADDRFEDLILNIESTTLLLEELELELLSADESEHVLDRCIIHYRRCTTKLQETSDEIKSSIQKSPRVGRVSWAIKERDVENLWRKLGCARSHLTLAMQLLARREAHKMHKHILVLLDNAVTAQSSRQSLPEYPSQCASQAFRRTKNGRCRGRPFWQLKFKNWLTATTWEIVIHQSNGNWTMLLRIETPRPFSAEVYRLCKHGDVRGLQHLLNARQISFTDVYDGSSQHDWGPGTLVSIAASNGQEALCEWLSSQGLWSDHMSCWHEWDWTDDQRVNAYRRYIEAVESDVATPKGSTGPYWWQIKAEECLEIILRNQDIPHHTLPLEDRFEMASKLLNIDAAPWLKTLGLRTPDTRLAAVLINGGWTAMHEVAFGIICTIRVCRSTSEWAHIGVQLLKGDADANAIAVFPWKGVRKPSTPLICLLLWSADLQCSLNALEIWLSILQEAGTDLEKFWGIEAGLWADLGLWHENYELGSYLSELNRPLRTSLKRLTRHTKTHSWHIQCQNHVTVGTYELRLPVGSYPKHHPVPTVIAWEPREQEKEEGPWESVSTTLLHGKLYDARAGIQEKEDRSQLRHREVIVQCAEDDASFAILSERRATLKNAPTRRSASASRARAPDDRGCRIWRNRFQWLPTELELGRWNEVSQTTSIFEQDNWYQYSFLTDIQDCQEDVDYISLRKLDKAKPAHTGKSGCPWGCGKVQLDKLAVPESCYDYHPRVREGYE